MIDAQDLSRRLAQLEKSNRRMKMGLLAIAALLLTSAKPSNVVTANAFILVDSAGRTRARLDLSGGDTPALIMYHRNGTDALELSVSNDLSALLLSDRSGKTRVDIGLNPTGVPSAVLSGVPPGTTAVIVSNSATRAPLPKTPQE